MTADRLAYFGFKSFAVMKVLGESKSKVFELSALVLGFVLGQGVMFAVQSYLIINNEVQLVGEVALSLGFLSLFIWVGDMGGVFLFRQAISESDGASFFTARVLFCVLIAALAPWFSVFLPESKVIQQIYDFAPLAVLLGSVSLIGFIDHLGLNKKVGFCSGFPWFIASIPLFIFDTIPRDVLGSVVGAAFCVGQILLVGVHYVFVRGQSLNKGKVELGRVVSYLKKGVAYNFSFAASQLYGRIVPVLVSNALGSYVLGYYVYARNIVNLYLQVASFAKRLEFKALCDLNVKTATLFSIIRVQYMSSILLLSSIIAVVIISSLAFVLDDLINPEAAHIVGILIALSVVSLFYWFSSALSQYLMAISRYVVNGWVQSVSLLFAIFGVGFLVDEIGLNAVYISEVVMHLLRIICFILIIKFIQLGRYS